MIEITPSAASKRHAIATPLIRRRAQRLPSDVPGVARDHATREKYHAIADGKPPLATLHSSQSSFIGIQIARKEMQELLKSP